jgi:xylulokinase
MDSSTSKECSEIREALGGKRNTIKITGSDIFERFSGPQIRKFYKENPERYSGTDKIHLVSSFMASILAGSSGPIDYADGSGMNLMNIKSKEWDPKALSATAPELEEKLPPLARSDLIVGDINSFFVRRFGFSPKCKIAIWSGDNPNSLIGLGIIEEKNAALSLGTSDTYFAYLKRLQLDYKGESHLFGAPTGDYMGLICFKNGSLARERIKYKFNLDWKRFSKILSKSPPGNFGKIMLPYFYAEIVPPVLKPQVFRFWLDDSDLVGNVRAIIESQFLSMRLHSTWINEKPEVIMATGGASANKEILQTASNIFQAKILKFDITNSAALGATFRAIHASNKKINKNLSWNAIIENFLLKRPYKAITPQKEYANIYDKMLKLYEACEDYVLKGGEKPTKLREEFLQTYSFNKNV